jgi:hypothetical protein
MSNPHRLLAAIFLAALVAVPLIEKGHEHGDFDRGRACATCVAAHHSPGATTPIVAALAPPSHWAEHTWIPSLPFVSPLRPLRSGRAPPASSRTTTV